MTQTTVGKGVQSINININYTIMMYETGLFMCQMFTLGQFLVNLECTNIRDTTLCVVSKNLIQIALNAHY